MKQHYSDWAITYEMVMRRIQEIMNQAKQKEEQSKPKIIQEALPRHRSFADKIIESDYIEFEEIKL